MRHSGRKRGPAEARAASSLQALSFGFGWWTDEDKDIVGLSGRGLTWLGGGHNLALWSTLPPLQARCRPCFLACHVCSSRGRAPPPPPPPPTPGLQAVIVPGFPGHALYSSVQAAAVPMGGTRALGEPASKPAAGVWGAAAARLAWFRSLPALAPAAVHVWGAQSWVCTPPHKHKHKHTL